MQLTPFSLLIAVSFLAFPDHRCTHFYLDESSKINPNCPKINPSTTYSHKITVKALFNSAV